MIVMFAVVLAIAPWSGSDLATASTHAIKYRLQVSGRPGEAFHLEASGLAHGWLAAFCTPKYCAPDRVDATLPASGNLTMQLELIRESETAPPHTHAAIRSNDGAKVIL